MKEDTQRWKMFQWVLYNVLKHNDSKLMRWWEILVRYFFMPFNTFWYYLNQHHEVVHDYGQIIRLFGNDYHMSIFRALLKPGNVFRVAKHEDGIVMLEKVDMSSTSDSIGTSTL